MKKNIFLTYLEFIPAIIILIFMRLLPYKLSVKIGAIFGRFIYYTVSPTRRDAMSSLEIAFPDKTLKERKYICRKSLESLGMTFFEFAKFPMLSNEYIKSIVNVSGTEFLDEALSLNRGVIVLASHLGNWEYISATTSIYGYNPHVIVRPLDNIKLDKYVEKYRTSKGAVAIPRNSYGLRGIYKALKNNKPVAFLIDQNSARNGVFVPFFDKLAATVRGPIQFAIKTKSPILYCYDVRNDDLSHSVRINKFEFEDMGDEEATIYHNTAKYTKIYEDIIRKNKEQWLWAHPRWKSRPEEQGK